MCIIRDPEKLLREFGITHPDQIDLEAIAWTQNARVKYRNLQGCDARILGMGNRAMITVKQGGNPRRQRFSIGHEIGHWLHHRGQRLMCEGRDIETGSVIGNSAEKTADRFAAKLMMPDFLLRESLRGHGSRFDMNTIRNVAEEFNTSLTATAIRLVEYEPAPCLLVSHASRGRKWFARSPMVSHRLFPKKQLDVESPAYDVLFNNAEDSQYLELIGADAWFDLEWAEEIEIWEQTVRIYDDEVITLLVVEDERLLER